MGAIKELVPHAVACPDCGMGQKGDRGKLDDKGRVVGIADDAREWDGHTIAYLSKSTKANGGCPNPHCPSHAKRGSA